MAERVVFLRPDAERIARAVRRVEGMRDETPLSFRRVSTESAARVFRVGTFDAAAWSKGQFRTVTLRYVTTTPNTVTAINLFANIGAATASRSCAIARDGTAWHLIAAEC